jgi:hypothetical protein
MAVAHGGLQHMLKIAATVYVGDIHGARVQGKMRHHLA